MKPYLIDTHAHLNLFDKKELPAVLQRAREAGITKIVSPACTLEQIGQCLPICDEYEGVYAAVGIHPTDLTDNVERDLEQVYTYAKREEKVAAIGEIGLDYYHDRFPHDLQAAFLIGQLNIAKQLGLPAILHCRAGKNPGENESAFVDLVNILKEADYFNAVAHCFSGNTVEAEKLLDMGLMLSFTCLVTYPQNEEMREIIKRAPMDRLLLETDAPFLGPYPNREAGSEPRHALEVAKVVAKVKNVPLDEVIQMTTGNAERFFGI